MDNEEKYSKVIRILKRHRPIVANKQRMTDEIMTRIQESSERHSLQYKLVEYLFNWSDNYWLRRAMTVSAVLLLGIFIVQQIVITDRMNSLEKQLIRTVNTFNGYRPEPGINQKLLLNVFINDQKMMDSITLSKSDLKELLNNYLELQKNYENIMQDFGLDPYLQKRIKQGLQKSTSDQEL